MHDHPQRREHVCVYKPNLENKIIKRVADISIEQNVEMSMHEL